MPNYDDIVAGMQSEQQAMGTAPTRYDKAVQAMQVENDSAGPRAALAVGLSQDVKPDEAAVHQALARRYNTTPEVVAAYPQEFKDRMAMELARSTMRDAPHLQQRIANQPQTAALIHDDLPNAAGVEKTLTARAASYLFNKDGGWLDDALYLGGQANRAAGAMVSPVFSVIAQGVGAPLAGFDALTGHAHGRCALFGGALV
jgi:hypothetical protein